MTILALTAATAFAADPSRIDVPFDPDAEYTVLDLRDLGGGKVEVTTT